MRRSFKCQSHWTHILQNKDSLFIKCCLLSESLAIMPRAPEPTCLGKLAMVALAEGARLPEPPLLRRGTWQDVPKHSP